MFQFEKVLSYVKKHFTLRDVLFLAVIFALFFVTRMYALDKFPIFSDEGIYIRWAKVAWHDSSWRFISLTDGRQPLQTWATIPFLKLFPDNALLGGRLFAVAFGAMALAGFTTLTYYLFGKKGSYIGAALYLLVPYYIFYERLALVDSAVNAAFVWVIFFAILLARTRRTDVAIVLGLVAGMGLLAKSSVQLFILMALFTPLLFFEKRLKKFIPEAINYYILYVVAGALAFALYNIQRLSPYFHIIAQKNTTFVMTLSEFMAAPFSLIGNNLKVIPTYLFWEMGFAAGILGVIGIIMLLKKEWRTGLLILVMLAIPYGAIGFFSRVLFPRYLIFMSTTLLIPATYALLHLPKFYKKIAWTCVVVVGLASYYLILINPKALPMPEIDRGQYIEGKTAVWGAQEVVVIARQQASDKKVILVAEGNFGLVGDVLDTFLRPTDTNISVEGVWPLNEEHIYAYQNKENKKTKIFIVFSHREEFPAHWPIRLVKKFEKPGNRAALYLYEYIPGATKRNVEK